MSPSDKSDTDQEFETHVRSKLPPITPHEKEILLQVVSKPEIKSIVENKEINRVWTAQKTEAWQKVSLEFCSHLNVTQMSGDQLKKAWENLKGRAKKQVNRLPFYFKFLNLKVKFLIIILLYPGFKDETKSLFFPVDKGYPI